ncbi:MULTISPECIES: recombinase family protein [unclassified Polaromonas]|uniref:recombinase family protein n=1 Tax=unclassified Polaromonas TaxID=2638319 RepID=UPI000F080901|nr:MULTISPECIES: recombinase family protein [unclassified Polaromonas]AYQ30501.1 recombinase family protein [Polaromonas sp. SP1]QGJ20916.1 recombinase family protein [Polaromonas sp. Pch-P]
MIYGYARVSTQEQELHTQYDALRKAGVQHIFEEKRSGGDTKCAELEKLLTLLRPGDILVVYKLDRLARSLKHLLIILDRINAQGAQFRSLTETIDTSTAAGRMMMQIVGAFAEFELEMIRERTRAGLHAAMRRGSKPGRPRAMAPAEESEAVRLVLSGQATKSAVARRFGTHISSIKRALHRANGQCEIFSEH